MKSNVKNGSKEAIMQFAGKGGIDDSEIKSLKKDWKKWSKISSKNKI